MLLNDLAANLVVTKNYQPIVDIFPKFIQHIDNGMFDEDTLVQAFKVLGIPFEYLSINTYITKDGAKKNQVCKPGLWLDSKTGDAILLYGFASNGKKAYVIPHDTIFLPDSRILANGKQIAYIPLVIMENVNLYSDAIKVLPILNESSGEGFTTNAKELLYDNGTSDVFCLTNPTSKQNSGYTFYYVNVDGKQYQVPKGCYNAITTQLMLGDADFIIGEFYEKPFTFQGKTGITLGFRQCKTSA